MMHGTMNVKKERFQILRTSVETTGDVFLRPVVQ
jgi:hypothetical protein